MHGLTIKRGRVLMATVHTVKTNGPIIKMNKENIVYDFWKRYEDADLLDREKVIEPIIYNFMQAANMPKKFREDIIKMNLMSYFDDLIEYMSLK